MHKKVLLVTPFYYGIGGVETSLRTLVRLLDQRGCIVKVCTMNVSQKIFHRFEGNKFFIIFYLCPLLWLKAIFSLRGISVVHAAGFSAALVARFLPKKFVVSTHAIYEGIYKLGKYEKWVLRGAKKILCLTKESVKEIGLPQCVEYRTLIDPWLFKPMNVKKSRKFTILFVARPLKKKGWDIIEELKNKMKDVKFLMLSDIPNPEMPSYYNLADLTITAALYKECFSRTILESLFCGTPVIISKNDIACEYIKEVGFGCQPTAEALTTMISAFKDNRRKGYSKYWRKKCRDYALKNYGEENLNVFLEAYNF